MAAIASLSDLVNRATGGNSGSPENIFWHKTINVAGTADTWTAGLWYSGWKYDGFPAGGANPTTVEAPTKATTGAIPFTNPGGGREKWLTSLAYIPGNVADISAGMLYDRLLHIGGLSGTTITAQTVGGSITRNTGGAGNQIFVEIYTAVGTTARTITATYTNQAGTGSRTTVATVFGGTAGTNGNEVNQLIALPLQAGDTGVQSVQSVTISATTGTAGNFGVVIARPLAYMVPAQVGSFGRDFSIGVGGMPEIDTDACLATAFLAATTTESPQWGMLATVEA